VRTVSANRRLDEAPSCRRIHGFIPCTSHDRGRSRRGASKKYGLCILITRSPSSLLAVVAGRLVFEDVLLGKLLPSFTSHRICDERLNQTPRSH
jgi:hypothetical protein